MVNIFADKVYDETVTISVTDGAPFPQELNSAFTNLPLVDASSIIGGFTYLEEATLELNFVGGLDLDASTDNRTATIDAKPIAIFDSQFNLFGGVDFVEIGRQNDTGGNVTITDFKGEGVTLDTYVDTPLEIGYDVQFGGDTDQFTLNMDGDQTLDVELIIRLIGRQP